MPDSVVRVVGERRAGHGSRLWPDPSRAAGLQGRGDGDFGPAGRPPSALPRDHGGSARWRWAAASAVHVRSWR